MRNKIKNITALLLTVIICFSLASGCNGKKDITEAKSNDTPIIADKPEETVKPVGLQGGNDRSEGWESYEIVYFGDSTFAANSMGDILEAFGETDGIKITSFGRTYSNLENIGAFNIYELCNFTGTAPNYTSAVMNTSKTLNAIMAEKLKTADYFIINSGRDFPLGSPGGEHYSNLLGLKTWHDYYKSENPSGETVLFVPYGFEEGVREDLLKKLVFHLCLEQSIMQ